MPNISVFNDVLGPIMIGPSSSHTAGPTRLGLLARNLLGEEPVTCRVTFDPAGSFACIYRTQGTDRGFAAGFLGLEPGDPRAADALLTARDRGMTIEFKVEPLQDAVHPNTALMELEGKHGSVAVRGLSTGGGMVRVTHVDGHTVEINGTVYHILSDPQEGAAGTPLAPHTSDSQSRILDYRFREFPSEESIGHIRSVSRRTWGPVRPVVPVPETGRPPLFSSQDEAVKLANGESLGGLTIRYEAQRSGWPEERVREYARKILGVMRHSTATGLEGKGPLTLTPPAAPHLMNALDEGRLLGGKTLGRAIVISLAVLEASNSRGVICAAPTAGSCGTLPGALLSAAESLGTAEEALEEALMAAGGAGLIIAREATFAAELAGCQAECGAASAMAAAALVDLAGGNADQALGASSVALQNILGLICDPVAGLVEVPCYGRNAMGAANAFVAANMVLGGYDPLIPLEETARAMLEVGKALSPDLRCTARGGLCVVPSARRLEERSRLP